MASTTLQSISKNQKETVYYNFSFLPTFFRKLSLKVKVKSSAFKETLFSVLCFNDKYLFVLAEIIIHTCLSYVVADPASKEAVAFK